MNRKKFIEDFILLMGIFSILIFVSMGILYFVDLISDFILNNY